MSMAYVVGGSAVLGVAGSYFSGKAAESGAQAGADASRYAADANAKVQWDMYTQNREDMQPYRDVGDPALKKLAQLMGIDTYTETETPGESVAPPTTRRRNPFSKRFAPPPPPPEPTIERVQDPRGEGFGSFAKPFSMEDYKEDPGYQFRLAEGNRAIDKGALARGDFYSGGTGKALVEYNQDMASQEYGNAYNRLTRIRVISGIGTVGSPEQVNRQRSR